MCTVLIDLVCLFPFEGYLTFLSSTRILGGLNLSISDVRVYFSNGGDNRGSAAQGAPGVKLHSGVG